jgi:FMNH2-dependent dimethyl sulfone monooxygenase
MIFGLYAPIPMATVGSADIAQAALHALKPLPDGAQDIQFTHGLRLLQAADEVGFGLALFAERHLGNDMSAWVLASAIGSQLNHVRPLVAVHPGLWDPVMTAKLAVSVDRLCKNRMAVNIVNGWFDQEFVMFGGKVLHGEERYQRTTEFIEIMRGLWTHETFSYQGAHYQLDKGQLLLKPASPTPPEIFSVSTSDRGRDFIADECDWWFVEMPKESQTTDEMLRGIEASVKDMNRRTARTGRRVRYGINPFVALGPSPEAALDTTIQQIFKFDPDPDQRKIERRMLPATKAGCMGTREAIVRQMRTFEDMGIELLLLKLIPTEENVRRIGEEIISEVNRDQLVAAQ